jgi:hypothetical protein
MLIYVQFLNMYQIFCYSVCALLKNYGLYIVLNNGVHSAVVLAFESCEIFFLKCSLFE